MQTPQYSDEKAVSPSVCPSVRRSVSLSNACIVTKRRKDAERRNSPYFAFFFAEFYRLSFRLYHTYNVRKIVSQFQSSTFGQNYPAARSAITEHLVIDGPWAGPTWMSVWVTYGGGHLEFDSFPTMGTRDVWGAILFFYYWQFVESKVYSAWHNTTTTIG